MYSTLRTLIVVPVRLFIFDHFSTRYGLIRSRYANWILKKVTSKNQIGKTFLDIFPDSTIFEVLSIQNLFAYYMVWIEYQKINVENYHRYAY